MQSFRAFLREQEDAAQHYYDGQAERFVMNTLGLRVKETCRVSDVRGE